MAHLSARVGKPQANPANYAINSILAERAWQRLGRTAEP